MSEEKVLSLILDEIHKRFNSILKDLSAKDLKCKSEKKSPAIGWIMGHLTGGQHAYLNMILQGKEARHLQELASFSTGEPSSYDNNPPMKRIVSLFESDLEEMREFITGLSIEQLNLPIPHQDSIPPFFKDIPVNKILANYMAHALTHLGQAIEVRRMLNKSVEGINS